MSSTHIYYCFRNSKDQSVIESDEVTLNGTSPYHFLLERLESLLHDILPSMKNHEERAFDLFYATDLIRPEQGIATIRKGPIEVERSILGSSAPGSIETLPYQYGIDNWKPAMLAKFPFPEASTNLLKENRFYDEQSITDGIKTTVSLIEQAFAANFSNASATALISQTGKLTKISGGLNFCPYPHEFPKPSVEESATDVLDVVIIALEEKKLTTQLPLEALEQHKARLLNKPEYKTDLLRILNAIKSGSLNKA